MADMKGTISLSGKGATRGEHSMPQSADLRNTMGKQLNEAYAKEAQDTQTGVTLESTNSIDKSEAVEVKNAATTGEAGNAGDPKTGDESTSERVCFTCIDHIGLNSFVESFSGSSPSFSSSSSVWPTPSSTVPSGK